MVLICFHLRPKDWAIKGSIQYSHRVLLFFYWLLIRVVDLEFSGMGMQETLSTKALLWCLVIKTLEFNRWHLHLG